MINIYSQNGDIEYKIIEFILDTPEDLNELKNKNNSAAIGSSAFIISTSEVYMLNSDKEWKKI